MISEKLIKKIIKKKLLESIGTYNPVAADQFDQTKTTAFEKIKANVNLEKIKADPEDPILFLINHLLGTIQETGPAIFFQKIKDSYSEHHGFMDNFTPTAQWKEEIDKLIEELSEGNFKKSGDANVLKTYQNDGYKMVPYSKFNDYQNEIKDITVKEKDKEELKKKIANILNKYIAEDTGIILYDPNRKKETVLIAKLTSSQARDARYYFDEKLQQMIKSNGDFDILRKASSFWTGDEDWLDYLEGDEGDLFGFISNIVGFGSANIFKKAAAKKAQKIAAQSADDVVGEAGEEAVENVVQQQTRNLSDDAAEQATKNINLQTQTNDFINLIERGDIKIGDKTFVEYISSTDEQTVFTFLKKHLNWSDNDIDKFEGVNDVGKEFIKAVRDKLKSSEDPDKLINAVIQKIKNINPDETLVPPPTNFAKHVVEGVNDELLRKYGQAADDVIKWIKEFDAQQVDDYAGNAIIPNISNVDDQGIIKFFLNAFDFDNLKDLDDSAIQNNAAECLFEIEKILNQSDHKVDLIKVIIQKIKNNNPAAMSDEIVNQGTKEMGKDAAENTAQQQAKNVSGDAAAEEVAEEVAEETTENVAQQVTQNAKKNEKLAAALNQFASLIPTTDEALKTQDSNGQNFVKILNFLRTNDKIKLNIDPQYIQHLKTTADAVENAIKNNDVTEIIFYLNRIDEAYSQLGNILKEKKADGTSIVKNFSIDTGSKTYIFLKNKIEYKSTNQALNHFYQIRENNIETLINILIDARDSSANSTQELQRVIQQNKVFIQNEIKMASQISADLSRPVVKKVAAETSQEAVEDTTSNVIGKHLNDYEKVFQENILTDAYKNVFGKKSISSDLQKATMDIIKQAQSAIPKNPATKDFKNQVINPLQTIFKDVNWESISHSDLDTKLADLVNNINSIQDNKNLRFDSIQIKFKKPKQGFLKRAKESENLNGDNLFDFIDNFCLDPLKDEIESIQKLLKNETGEKVSEEILKRTKALKEFIDDLNNNLLKESKENLQIISLFKPDQKILLNEWAFVVPVILFISEAVAWAVLDHYVGHYLRIESANLIEDGKFYYLKGQLNKNTFLNLESFSNRNIKNLIIETPQEVNHQTMNKDITDNITKIIGADQILQKTMEDSLNIKDNNAQGSAENKKEESTENSPSAQDQNTNSSSSTNKKSSTDSDSSEEQEDNNNKSDSGTGEQDIDIGDLDENGIYTIPRLKGGYYTLAEILNDNYANKFIGVEGGNITGRSLRNLYQDKMLFAGDRIDFNDIINNNNPPKIYTFRKPNDNVDVFDKRDTVEVAMAKIRKARQERARKQDQA